MNQPSFDTWTSVFLFASVQGLFVSIVLFITGKENKVANRLLASLIFYFRLPYLNMYFIGPDTFIIGLIFATD